MTCLYTLALQHSTTLFKATWNSNLRKSAAGSDCTLRVVRHQSVQQLNQVLADSLTLRDLYKKHHW